MVYFVEASTASDFSNPTLEGSSLFVEVTLNFVIANRGDAPAIRDQLTIEMIIEMPRAFAKHVFPRSEILYRLRRCPEANPLFASIPFYCFRALRVDLAGDDVALGVEEGHLVSPDPFLLPPLRRLPLVGARTSHPRAR